MILGGGQWYKGYYAFGAHYDPIEGSADSHFMFVNESGDSVRTVIIDFEFNDRIYDAILLQDSTFVILGRYNDSLNTDSKPFVAHLDSLGSILWMKTHDNKSNLNEFVINMAVSKDGGYVFSGEEYETPQGWLDKFLYKVDSVGNFVWRKSYHENFTQRAGDVISCKDGGFAFVGTGLGPQTSMRSIIKTDSAGNKVWEKKHGTNTYHEGFVAVRELYNGDFICAGSSFHTHNNQDIPDINLSRLDSASNLLWSKDFTYTAAGPQVNDIVQDLKVTADGGFVITGFITNVACCQRNDVFILKTDSSGLITSLNTGFQEVTAAWKVYPNPTQGQITIPEVENLELIQVFNLQGQKVQEFLPNQTAETQIQLDGPSGIYLIQLQKTDGVWESVKVVKE